MINQPFDPALPVGNHEGLRHRVESDVTAADVQEPGDVIGLRLDQDVSALLFQHLADAALLVGDAFAGIVA
ncbi:hypothetical protein D3C71_2160520 [compost metagenome]